MQEAAVVAEVQPKIFADVSEVEITRAIANEFHDVLIDRADSDVIIIGAGPLGADGRQGPLKHGVQGFDNRAEQLPRRGVLAGGLHDEPRYGQGAGPEDMGTSSEFHTKKRGRACT